MNVEMKSGNRRLWLVLGLLACLQSGCAMCPNDYDCYYPAYGGSVPREDMVCGRVNSIIRPASRGTPRRVDRDDRRTYREGDVITAPLDETDSETFESEQPYDLGSEGTFPEEAMPMGVQPMNFEEAPFDLGYEDGDDSLTANDWADEGYAEEPVEVYEPEFGYDEVVDSSSEASSVEQVDWDAVYPSENEAASLSVSQNVTPIGSGVAPNQLRSSRPRTLRTDEIPPGTLSEPPSAASSPTDTFIDRLRPLSEPPMLGAPSEMPRY